MKLICSNQQLINVFSDKNTLLDGKIKKIEIFKDSDSSVSINIDFHMRSSSDFKEVQLRFIGCKEYSFSYMNSYNFYNVELVKLLQNDDGFSYISFDPSEECKFISDDDQDIILCEGISAYH